MRIGIPLLVAAVVGVLGLTFVAGLVMRSVLKFGFRPPNGRLAEQHDRIPGFDHRFSVQEISMNGNVSSMAFSPDGNYLVIGSQGTGQAKGAPELGAWDSEVKIWDLVNRKEHALMRYEQWIKRIAFLGNERYIAIACSTRSSFAGTNRPNALGFIERPGELIVYEFPAMLEVKKVDFPGVIESFCASPDGERIAVGWSSDRRNDFSYDKQEVQIINWKTHGKPIHLRGVSLSHPRDMPSMTFGPDGKQLVISKRESPLSQPLLQRFDPETGMEMGNFISGPNPGGAFIFVPEIRGDKIGTVAGGVFAFLNFKNPNVQCDTYRFSERPDKTRILDPLTISHDKQQLAGFLNREPQGGTKIYWEDLNEKKTLLVYDAPNPYTQTRVCRFSPVDANLLAVGVANYKGLDNLDKTRGAVLLFRRVK